MKRLLIALPFLAAFATACSDEPIPSPPPASEQLITEYDDPQEMIFGSWAKEIDPVQPNPFTDAVWVICSGGWNPLHRGQGWISRSSDPERFDSLVKAHGDTHWNRSDPISIPCMFRVTVSLHVVCNRDYDADHPTGTLLDDILTVKYRSADQILVDGEYVWTGVTDQQLQKGYTGYEFDAPLTEFNRKRLKLLSMLFTFWLNKAPTETGDYVFTCTWINEDGKKLTASTEPLRIQGER